MGTLTRMHQRRVLALGLLAVLASLVFAWLVLLLDFVSIVPFLIWAFVVAVVWRPRVGVYILLVMVSLFESLSLDPLMTPGSYLHYGLQHTLGLSGIVVSPLEMMLIVTLLVWLVQGAVRGRLDYRGGHLGWTMAVFAGTLFTGLVWGIARGGILNVGLFELRPLLYMVVSYVLAANLIRTRQQVRMLTTVGLLAISLFTLECAYRRIFLIDTGELGQMQEMWYSHEDVVLMALVPPVVIGQLVFGAPRWQRIFGVIFLPLSLYAMMATERRAGQIGLIMSIVAVFLVLLFAHRKAFYSIAVPSLIIAAIYLPIFWNASGILAQPARAIRSVSNPDPRDESSNISREMEKVNVIATVRAFPLMGVGFGQPFLQVIAIPDISFFPLWNYEPHHNLFWVWFKSGALGFIALWTLFGGTAALSARFARTLGPPELKVFAIFALAGIVSALTFSYVDLGLTSGRVGVLLGVLIGTVSVLDNVREA